MKKKGFTLIELLAVIVILAIIALIATPLVLKYIETARTNSKITSTQNYMKAVENALASYSITHKGQSYSEGCYEISTLNIDLDISIKGELPSEGTICIEDNKIEKGIIKYPDNKIIKYEDSKSTLSDEETFESFNSASNYIIDADVEFAYDESMSGYTATLTITKDIAEQFKEEMDYDFIIDDGKKKLMYAVGYLNLGLLFYSHDPDISTLNGLLVNQNEIKVLSMEELTDVHNVKIGNARPIEESTYFSICSDGAMTIVGYDLVSGNAQIVIKDEKGTEYYNDNVELEDEDGNGIIGADSGCRGNIPNLPDVYTALTNGKTITIEVTQKVDGKEIISTVSKNLNSITNNNGSYLSRQYILLLNAFGC